MSIVSDVSTTQTSVKSTERSTEKPVLKRQNTGLKDKSVARVMEITTHDLNQTRKDINHKIAEIKMEIVHSMSASAANAWSDKKLALLYVDLNNLDGKKVDLQKRLDKLQNTTGAELEKYLHSHHLD